jgi:hypothetical protein
MPLLRRPRNQSGDFTLGNEPRMPIDEPLNGDSPRIPPMPNEPRVPVPPPGDDPLDDRGRGSEDPRSRTTPPSPRTPTPMPGTPQPPAPAGPSGGGPIPFQPLGGGSKAAFGRMRGLQGGGLGLMAPMAAPAENQSIDDLIQQLLGGMNRGRKF